MTTKGEKIACDCENDPRLIAGIAAIASHVAKYAEWKSESQAQLAEATAEACREAFGVTEMSKNKTSSIRVVCEPFQDRIEVSIEFPGEYSEKEIAAVQKTKSGITPKLDYKFIDGQSRLKFVQYEAASSAT
jgi:hypothetical protein